MKKLIIPLALGLLMLSACDLFFVSQKIVYQEEPRIEESQTIEEPELQEEDSSPSEEDCAPSEEEIQITEPEPPVPEVPEPPQEEPEEPDIPEIPIDETDARPSWTIMVYMAADNDLEAAALDDLNEMENVLLNDNLTVLALVDRSADYDETNGNWSDTRLLEIQWDRTGSDSILSRRTSCPALGLDAHTETELDMSNPRTLEKYVSWVTQNYQSDYYALVMWGHGTGWRGPEEPDHSRAFAIDDKSGTFMGLADFADAVTGKRLDVIGFDTCFGVLLENIYQLRNLDTLIIGSPCLTPNRGWDYEKVLTSFCQSERTIEDFSESVLSSQNYTVTSIKTSEAVLLKEKTDSFGTAVANYITDRARQEEIMSKMLYQVHSYNANQFPCDKFLDIYSMADTLGETDDELIKTASEELCTFLSDCGKTNTSEYLQCGIYFTTMIQRNVVSSVHESGYVKGAVDDQIDFVKDSTGWVPNMMRKEESLLDKLFYTAF